MIFNFDFRGELACLENRRAKAAMDLSNLEEQIYQLEGNYLRDSKSFGNISLGYDGYRVQKKKLNDPNVKGGKNLKSGRIFSNSAQSNSRLLTTVSVGLRKKGSEPSPEDVEVENLKKTGMKPSQAEAPRVRGVKTSMVQGLRGRRVFVRSRNQSTSRYMATSGARRLNPVGMMQKQKKSPNTKGGLVSKLSWIQLRQECLKVGLPGTGKKSEMIARLGWDNV